MNCPECGNKIMGDSDFCRKCGSRIARCSKCGELLTDEDNYCPECGNRIEFEKFDTDSRNKLLANFALAFTFFGMLFFVFLIPAIILSIIQLVKIGKKPDKYGGEVKCWFSLVTSIIFILIYALFFASFMQYNF